ncbi:MAG TPA: MBL fold metallo-hydrolase [Rickettsiales bacterium]|nr:MBL fold metallo-hydrolase [Rickettsiales bacterium]
MGKEDATYLKDYKNLSTFEKLKYNLLTNLFTGSPIKKFINGFQITFLGAAKTVTGSKYLLEKGKTKILLDCGLFQGLKELRLRNWNALPINPKNLDAVILTHAHLDHSGYLPLLIKNGFKGRIYCTEATFDLCKILLPDSGFLQEEDARYAKKHQFSKHKNPKPLYTQKDAINTFKYFYTVNFNEEIKINDDFSFSIVRAGHIIGAGSVLVKSQDKSILFSGDLGRPNSPIVHNPAKIPHADYIVVESTYGNRLHTETNPEDDLADIINKTVAKGGKIIMPAFSVGRTQKILYYINRLKNRGQIPDLTVFLDSPMSVKVTQLIDDYVEEEKLSREEYRDIYKSAKFCITREQSKRIGTIPGPCIIISASGMATGGRVLHHIANFGTKPNCTIVFAGYQAEGTRGRDLTDGKKEIKIHGNMVHVRAKIETLANMSDHADCKEILEWLKAMPNPPKKVFVTHGEVSASQGLARQIEEKLGWKTEIPEYLETEKLI